MLEPGTLGEQKSKAAQLGIKRLMEVGIMPHIVACRATNPVKEKVREKISMYTNVPMKRVITMHDVESIYTIPESLREAGIDREVLTVLDLHDRVDQGHEDQARIKWRWFVDRIGKAQKDVTVAVTGKYATLRDAYASIIKACEHCGVHLGVNVNFKWLDTTAIDPANVVKRLGDVDGIIVPGGFGVRGTEGKIECIRYARENKIPYLGLCLGFQMAVIEFARNVCGIRDAHSTEFDKNCKNAVIDILPEQKVIEGLGGNMRLGGRDVVLTPSTVAAALVQQRRQHSPALPPSLRSRPQVHRHSGKARSGLQRPASHATADADSRTAKGHASLFPGHPGPPRTDKPAIGCSPQPMFMGLVKAAVEHAAKVEKRTAQTV